ncbi:stalk domain-containing protein [Fontibacillus sp. BL9]|uniref:stalk domain-containing protein n=1 Tax=Fontibacillus sp. BL9 TaxID=3389971 RepID=UPI00397A2487
MKKMGYLLTGLALGLTLSVTSPVLAQNVKSITAKLNSTVSVRVNGDEIHLNAPPINYNNLNYLPVGEISRALGLNVSYDKKSDEIRIVGSNNPSESKDNPMQQNKNEGSEKSIQNIELIQDKELNNGESLSGEVNLKIYNFKSQPANEYGDNYLSFSYDIGLTNYDLLDSYLLEIQFYFDDGTSLMAPLTQRSVNIPKGTIKTNDILYKGFMISNNVKPIAAVVTLRIEENTKRPKTVAKNIKWNI